MLLKIKAPQKISMSLKVVKYENKISDMIKMNAVYEQQRTVTESDVFANRIKNVKQLNISFKVIFMAL